MFVFPTIPPAPHLPPPGTDSAGSLGDAAGSASPRAPGARPGAGSSLSDHAG